MKFHAVITRVSPVTADRLLKTRSPPAAVVQTPVQMVTDAVLNTWKCSIAIEAVLHVALNGTDAVALALEAET
jgi:hypothetical protein